METHAPHRERLPDALVAQLQLAHAPLGLLLRTLRALLPRRGLLISSSLAHGPFDLLARDLAPLRHLRFLPRLDDRVEDVGRPELRSDATLDTGVLLSDSDLDVEIRRSHAHCGIVAGAGTRNEKRRRLDTLFGSRLAPAQRVDGIVVCEHASRALEILQGSTTVLDADRPFVVTRLDAGPPSQNVLRLLAACGYMAFDQQLAPLDGGATGISRHGEWILALHGEGAFRRMANALLDDDVPGVDTDAAWNDALWSHLRLEARSGGIRIERRSAPAEITVSIDREIARWGFYPPEGDPGAGWSWIGPRPRAGLMLPGMAARLDLVRLHAAAAIDRDVVDRVQVVIDGEPAHVRPHWNGDHGVFDVTPSVRSVEWSPLHRLEISCPETRRANDQDRRLVALALSSVTLCAGRS